MDDLLIVVIEVEKWLEEKGETPYEPLRVDGVKWFISRGEKVLKSFFFGVKLT